MIANYLSGYFPTYYAAPCVPVYQPCCGAWDSGPSAREIARLQRHAIRHELRDAWREVNGRERQEPPRFHERFDRLGKNERYLASGRARTEHVEPSAPKPKASAACFEPKPLARTPTVRSDDARPALSPPPAPRPTGSLVGSQAETTPPAPPAAEASPSVPAPAAGPPEPAAPIAEPVRPGVAAPAPAPAPAVAPRAEPTPEPLPGTTLNSAADIILTHFDLADTAAGINGADHKVGQADLRALAYDNPNVPEDVRRSARTLVENPALLNAVDTANGGGVDDVILRQDLEKSRTLGVEGEIPAEWTPGGAAAVLDRHLALVDVAAGSGSVDEKFEFADLQAVLASPNAPADLRAAAGYLVDNPAAWNRLKSFNPNIFGQTDEVVGRADLQAATAGESNQTQA